jgi:hypothetical protein
VGAEFQLGVNDDAKVSLLLDIASLSVVVTSTSEKEPYLLKYFSLGYGQDKQGT